MKFFDFGAFQKIEKLLSHDKILLHMFFGAFHDTSCSHMIFFAFCYKIHILNLSFMLNYSPAYNSRFGEYYQYLNITNI